MAMNLGEILRLIEKQAEALCKKKSRRKPLPKKVAKRDFFDLKGLDAEDDENDKGAANALYTLEEMNHIDEHILIEPVSVQHLRYIHETCKKAFIGPEMDIGVCAVCDRLVKEVCFHNVSLKVFLLVFFICFWRSRSTSSSFSFSAMEIFQSSMIPIFSRAFQNMFAYILILHPCN